MDFSLTDEQREIQALAREVADTEIAPHAADWDREHRFPHELFAKLGQLGLMGVCVPEELGGAGADFISYVLVLEELSRADAGVGVTVAVHTSAATLPIVAFGTDEQRERFVPPLARGEVIGAFALTEPGSGSDAGSLRTTAVPDGDGWRITGRKQWCTNGSHASTFLLFARTDLETAGARGVSAFLLGPEHVEVTREEEKLGLHSSSTADLRLDGDVLVGRDRLLHEERKGFAVAMATLDGGRIGIAAQAVGIAEAALETARSYALEREQFGKRIADFQAIQFTLADMATQIAAARQLTWRAAWLKQAGLPHGAEGAMAKLFASRVAVEASRDAIQVLGGYGYTREFPAERYYRDAKITEIYEGTNEIQRIVIARDLLAMPSAALPRPPSGPRPGQPSSLRRMARARDEPVRLTKIYTRGGDAGQTSLGDGSRVSKLDLRLVAYGTVDELNSALGVVLAARPPDKIRLVLERVQNELFDVGADLSVPLGRDGRLRVAQSQVDRLEADCDRFNAELPELRSFVLPGGTQEAAGLHVARTICRRAERETLRAAQEHDLDPLTGIYLNRLSDLLFVLARAANAAAGRDEPLWRPGNTQSG